MSKSIYNENEAGTILIVDDTPANLEFLIMLLQKEKFNTSVAVDGITALEQAEVINPDVILLDIMMPGIDGFETCRRLKNNPITQPIPVIFMSALSDSIVKVKGFDAGGVDYITKPIEIKEVLVRIRAHQSVYKMQQKLEQANKLLNLAQENLQQLNGEFDKKVEERTIQLIELNKELTQQGSDNRKVFEKIKLGYWRWEFENDFVTWSDEMYRIFGYHKSNMNGNKEKIIVDNIYSEDQNKVIEANKKVLDGEEICHLVYRIVKSDGYTCTILRGYELELDENNNAISMFGTDQDITNIINID